MKAIGYVRVSTEEQASSGVSLAAQADKVRAYAALYEIELVDVVEDAGQSAKTLGRPGLQLALEAIRDGAADALIVAKLDRLTRSVVDLSTLIHEYFGDRAKHPASLLSVGDQVDTRSAAGRLVLNILMSVSEWEREAIGERTKTALRYKMEQGAHIGAVPYGFERDGTRLAAVEEEAEIIDRIRRLRAEGASLRDIAEALNGDGIRTKRGSAWAANTVKRVLDRAARIA
jgi:DNA invertase Pin-like site-specific DNA recombinase